MFASASYSTFSDGPTALTTRPRIGGGPPQTLLFLSSCIHELLLLPDDAREGSRLKLAGASMRRATQTVYEPTRDSVYFVDGLFDCTVMKLDRNNVVSVAAGSDERLTQPSKVRDGYGTSARFLTISALEPDGKGHIFVADGNVIRKMHVASGGVLTLANTRDAAVSNWVALAFNPATNILFAASSCAIYRVPTSNARAAAVPAASGSGDGVPAPATTAAAAPSAPQLIAGQPGQEGYRDGCWNGALFRGILHLTFGPDGHLYVTELGGRLRRVAPPLARATEAGGGAADGGGDGVVSTVLLGGLPVTTNAVAFLPTGELLACGVDAHEEDCVARIRLGFTAHTAAGTAAGASPQGGDDDANNLHDLIVPKVNDDGADGGGGGSAIVTVKVGDRAFAAHRAVLSARSEYFRRLLEPGSGFAESGAAEVYMSEVDPEAFGWLLTCMYNGPVARVPEALLRPVAVLAERLLLTSAAFRAQLRARLMAGVTAGNVVSELGWAYQHDMSDMVAQLLRFLVENRRVATQEVVGEVAARHPMLAAELVKALMQAP
ncbi:Ankyrin repeat and BTB/POZ domain-containing protein 1 [Pleodorina starrii]|nr:Ankyrin repeat and BTB/POZ domain-containing protein 1 [Pleodorina starrii]